jgi:hypothetical protein
MRRISWRPLQFGADTLPFLCTLSTGLDDGPSSVPFTNALSLRIRLFQVVGLLCVCSFLARQRCPGDQVGDWHNRVRQGRNPWRINDLHLLVIALE